MSESLFSPSWYRVADLTPRLRQHIQLHRHEYRGRVWYIMQDQLAGRSQRFSPEAYQFIGLMNGVNTVQQLWDVINEQEGDAAPTQEEIIQLLGQLHSSDALICDVPPDSRELFRRFQRHEKMKWKSRFWSPLAVKFPLWDPEDFLERTLPFVKPLLSKVGFFIWLLIILIAAVYAVVNWNALTENVIDRAFTPNNLLILWFIYPVVKAIHELAHGYAVKYYGGEVHEIGIMLLVLVPVPYIDASSSWGFRDKRQRMLVSAAGIMAELLMGSIALFIWLNVQPGIVHLVAYNVILICGISTILFNGNPLLRFDGYYVLSDGIESPNLGARSTTYLGYLIQRYILKSKEASSPADTKNERWWLIIYGVSAFIYRLFIMFAIIMYIATKFFIVGILLSFWAVFTQIIIPFGKNILFLFTSPKLRKNRNHAIGIASFILISILVLVFLFPVPLWTKTEGVIWPSEQSKIRMGMDGVITKILVPEGTWVKNGQAIITSNDPFLIARVNILEARKNEIEIQLHAVETIDRVQKKIVQEELKAVNADLTHAQKQVKDLTIRSARNGYLFVPRASDLQDRFVRKGQLVAYVIDPSDSYTIKAVISQNDIDLVRKKTDSVDIVIADWEVDSIQSNIVKKVPGGSYQLPTSALGTYGGGSFPVNPRDNTGRTSIERVFEYELQLPSNYRSTYLGRRVHVRFDHGFEPIGLQVYRAIRQLFLRTFNV